VIGTEVAAKSAPDGYTLFMGTLGNFSVNQHLYLKMSVDPVRDFAPITQVVDVHSGSTYTPPARKQCHGTACLARARPGQLHYASPVRAARPHLAAELLKRMGNVDIVHVPYKGSAPSMQDVIGGQVPMTFDSLLQALPHIRDKRLKALAVLASTARRSCPTCRPWTSRGSRLRAHQLVRPGGAAATPKEIVARLNADVVRVLHTPRCATDQRHGGDRRGHSAEEFGERIRSIRRNGRG